MTPAVRNGGGGDAPLRGPTGREHPSLRPPVAWRSRPAAASSTVPRPPRRRRHPANSPIHLLGTVEQWGITGQTKMRTLRLSTEGLTGAQLQALLRKLPEGKYVLEVQKEEGV